MGCIWYGMVEGQCIGEVGVEWMRQKRLKMSQLCPFADNKIVFLCPHHMQIQEVLPNCIQGCKHTLGKT